MPKRVSYDSLENKVLGRGVQSEPFGESNPVHQLSQSHIGFETLTVCA